jgi:hypothetical protein
MSFVYTNVFSNEELDYLTNHPDVLAAKSLLDKEQSTMIYLSLPITDLLRDTLQLCFGLNLSKNTQIPMRWIKGDTKPHIDTGLSNFENTYLIYLNDSPGEFIIDSKSYPIQSNTGFVFNEGLSHETQNTGTIPRLLLGPMNELVEPVGATPSIVYFNTEADALNTQNSDGYSIDFVVGSSTPGTSLPYTSWRIASNSTGTSPQNIVYNNDDTLINDGFYFVYPANPCFLEGSTVLCKVNGVEKYIPIEQLNKGTLVKTSLNGYVPVVLVGKGIIENPGDDERTENRLYKCSTDKYHQLKEDLYITGGHSILEFNITEKQKEDTFKYCSKVFITDNKYRLMACVDERAEPWNSKGTYTIWHFALKNNSQTKNYGVYVNGGLLVESCSISFLEKNSNMNFK